MNVLAVDFGRILTAMVTPFDQNLNVDLGLSKKLARHLVNLGNDGLVVSGTTGESPTIGKQEKLDLFKAVVEEVGGQATVIAGTGSYNTAESIILTREAEKSGVDGVMLVVPYYNKPSQEGLYRHFKVIAESTSLPVMLYNIPGRSAINMTPETVARLAEVENIVAIKEAAGSMDQVAELKKILPADFAVYSGDDSMTLPMLSVGCKGIVSVAGHIIADKIKEMVNAYVSGNITLAAQLHIKLFPIFKGMFITSNPTPVKTALNMMGVKVGGVRLPLVDATEQEKETIKKLLKEHGLI
ncbi:dihydrodipicolinate synthase [Desulfofarcimen acetoxidans DSM 771]|uniref:4-hydroxy-tetrahydrodipicolinate synthase n=1 Tax=Desulfofarcimen acetoxidans (strain ATCC 49208 / DSM 771 / KCTC 5769 / VKM B-1644 / 5575) TaxID=485916 RepID=C8W4M0_DESAS|nr:dihydrodipicolinate synthase [Desulfofarcimen acetoxidans DSM 771]